MKATQPLLSFLGGYGIPRINFEGTLTTQSGKVVAMMAPVMLPTTTKLEDVVRDGAIFAVFWLSGPAQQTRFKEGKGLLPGIYALRLSAVTESNANVEFITPQGVVAHTAKAVFILGGEGRLIDKIKDALRRMGLDTLDTTVSTFWFIDFHWYFKPSHATGSFLFWHFHLW